MTHETFECTIPLRLADLNSGGHVDNGVYLQVVDEARTRFLGVLDPDRPGHELFPSPGGGIGANVVAQQTIEYRRELGYDPRTPFVGPPVTLRPPGTRIASPTS